jgi:hypothetical protein
MKKFIIVGVLSIFTYPLFAQVEIVLSNSSEMQRHEVVELSDSELAKKLLSDSMVICDAFGVDQPYQISHDGKVLLYASVRPYGKAVYKVEKGLPVHSKGRTYVSGRFYAERADDISFENDRAGFRIYGPATQKRGERSYGIDLWVKHSSELLVDSLYRLGFSRRLNYHLDYGLGMDPYGVGPTLGCGTPALMVGDSICYPWCYEKYEILDNGPLRFTLRLDFAPVKMGDDMVTEHRLMQLDRGSNFCKTTVWYEGITRPVSLASGLAVRVADTTSVMMDKNYIHYADPTMEPERYNSQIFTALIFPDGVDEVRRQMFDEPMGANAGHALGIVRNYTGQPYTYYLGMAWSDLDVRSQEEWQIRIQHFLQCLRQGLGQM